MKRETVIYHLSPNMDAEVQMKKARADYERGKFVLIQPYEGTPYPYEPTANA